MDVNLSSEAKLFIQNQIFRSTWSLNPFLTLQEKILKATAGKLNHKSKFHSLISKQMFLLYYY